MKKIIALTIVLLMAPIAALGAEKTVSITWTGIDTTDVTGYRMHYSYSSDMASQVLACE
ncbi:MAG: hypothetical protein ACD_15C00048G0001, partial [uncultured bacterium]